MRKKISLLLCVLATMLCFTACGSGNKTMDYDEATIEQTTEFLLSYCASTDEATLEQWKSMTDFNVELQLTEAGIPVTQESFLGALEAWQAATKECGEYIGHGDYTFEASTDELKVTTAVEFSDREATITFVFDEDSYLDSMTVDAEYSTGEILEKAGLNTILGMGTVFIVLIFISFLISLFKYIPAIEKKFKKQPVQEVKTEKAPAQNLSAVETPVADDLELIAVISAAIAAAREAEGYSKDGFVVRSIRRRPSNKWNA